MKSPEANSLEHHLQGFEKCFGPTTDWQAAADASFEVLWSIAEARPDFDRLPDWIAEAEGGFNSASEKQDALEFGRHFIGISENLVDRYGHPEKRSAAIAELNAAQEILHRVSFSSAGSPSRGPWLPQIIRGLAESMFNLNGAQRLSVAMAKDQITVGRHCGISFHRTLRIPEDGRDYPLPAGFGRFPICRVEDYADKLPAKWLKQGGFFIPLYQREALFIEFFGAKWRPNAVKVSAGCVNAISGQPYSLSIQPHRQDYVVVPDQRWLDGINSGDGRVGQFVAMPLGQGYTIEAQVTDEEVHGGMQLAVFDPKAGRFPEEDPAVVAERMERARKRKIRNKQRTILHNLSPEHLKLMESLRTGQSIEFIARFMHLDVKRLALMLHEAFTELRKRLGNDAHLDFEEYILYSLSDFEELVEVELSVAPEPSGFLGAAEAPSGTALFSVGPAHREEMGIAKGGSILQQIFEDVYGSDSWATDSYADIHIHIVNSEVFEQITGKAPPPTPITVERYARAGIPWFRNYEEKAPVLGPAKALQNLRSVDAIDRIRGNLAGPQASIRITPNLIQRIHTPTPAERLHMLLDQARTSIRAKRYQLAIRQCTHALQLSRHALALEIRTRCNLALGRFAEAEADASEWVDCNDKNISALCTWALALHALGERAEARSAAEEAARLAPDNHEVKEVLSSLTTNIPPQ